MVEIRPPAEDQFIRFGPACHDRIEPAKDGQVTVGPLCQRLEPADRLRCILVLADSVQDLDKRGEGGNLIGVPLHGRPRSALGEPVIPQPGGPGQRSVRIALA